MKVDRYDCGLVLVGACLIAGSLWQGLAHPGDPVVNVAVNCWLPVVILVLGHRVAGNLGVRNSVFAGHRGLLSIGFPQWLLVAVAFLTKAYLIGQYMSGENVNKEV